MKVLIFVILGMLFVVSVLLVISAVKEENELYGLLEDKDKDEKQHH